MKKLLVFLLALTMLLGCLVPVQAAELTRTVKVAMFTVQTPAHDVTNIKNAVLKWLGQNEVYVQGERIAVEFTQVDAASITSGGLSAYDVLLIAGGAGGGTSSALGEDGRNAIRTFVDAGGGYLGVGSGAYIAPLTYVPAATECLKLINQKVEYDPWNHGQGQLVVKPRDSGTIITDGMEVGKNYIAYGVNPVVLLPGEATAPDEKMGEVINVVEYVSNPINNVPAGKTPTNMTGTPAVAAASYGSGRVVISGIQPQMTADNGYAASAYHNRQPVEMDDLLGRMLLYAAGCDDIKVVPVSALPNEFGIVGEWLWSSTVYSLGENGAEIIISHCAEMGITDLYLLVKGTAGTVYYLKNDQSGAPLAYTDRDVLQEVIDAAHARGMRVHAWITSANDKAYKLDDNKDEGRYQFIRGREDNLVENYNISFLSEDFIEYSENVAREIAANYDVDGLHFDYIRYNHAGNGWGPEDRALLIKPVADGGYGLTQEQYNLLVERLADTFDTDTASYKLKKDTEGYWVSQSDSRALGDGELGGTVVYTPTRDSGRIFKAYADNEPGVAAFVKMRCDLVENYAERVTTAAKTEDPNLIISAALMPEGAYAGDYKVSGTNSNTFGLVHYGQDHAAAAQLYDYVTTMLYTASFGASSQWVAALADNDLSLGNKVVAGLQFFDENSVRVSSEKTASDVEAARRLAADKSGLLGIALFRNGTFFYVKNTVDEANRLARVKFINGRSSTRPIVDVVIRMQEGVTAVGEVALGGGFEGGSAEISPDGKTITIADFTPIGLHETGTVDFSFAGTVNRALGAASHIIYTYKNDGALVDSPLYQITEYDKLKEDPTPPPTTPTTPVTSDNITTETKTNADGSVTTTVTNRTTGTVTETTTYTDGAVRKTVTEKSGAVSSTVTLPGTLPTGGRTLDAGLAQVRLTAAGMAALAERGTVNMVAERAAGSDAVSLRILADGQPVSTVPGGLRVLLPQAQPPAGAVAALVNPDGTVEPIPKSAPVEGGVAALLPGSATVRILSNAVSFSDVSAGYWSRENVDFVTARGLFQGTTPTVFSPNMSMNRAMLATVLHRLEGIPAAGGVSFGDVDATGWYGPAVAWAHANQIVEGEDGRFLPFNNITREQIAAMLFRYARTLELDTSAGRSSLQAFPDAGDVSGWAAEAMEWAVGTGIVSGDAGELSPGRFATRGEVAAMVQRFVVYILK